MAAKSRLGKGLGALFPALPGENESVQQKSVVQSVDMPDDVKTNKSAKKHIGDHSESSDTSVSQQLPLLDVSKVSRETSKKNKNHRNAMPSLGEITHPSDVFFAHSEFADADVTSSSIKRTPDASTQEIRETSASTKVHKASDSESADSKEIELKPVQGGYLVELSLDQIGPNAQQPRTIFDEDELKELAASIQEVGILQPIVVRARQGFVDDQSSPKLSDSENVESGSKTPGKSLPEYELIMGERRWRASKLAGLHTIPAIVKTTVDDNMLRDALLENLHRVALNPLEEAAAYQQMIEEFGLTQLQLSKSVSKSRPQIANTLRLLNLPVAVQKKVAASVLSAGHARALLSLDNEAEMDKLANRIIAEGLSVRSTEEIVALKSLDRKQAKIAKKGNTNAWNGSPLQQNLENRFETKVAIKGTAKHGRIEIVFSSPEDMERILGLLIPGGSTANQDGWV